MRINFKKGGMMRFLGLVLGMMLSVSSFADQPREPVNVNLVTLLSGATATGAGLTATPPAEHTFQASCVNSAGAGSATIKIQASNVAVPLIDADWLDLGTITLTTGTTAVSDGFTSRSKWKNVRANITAISGTNDTCNVYMGY